MNDFCQTELEISFFFDKDQNASFKHVVSDLPTKLFLEGKITKRERRAIETFINNPLAKERVFCRLNELFVSDRTGDIIFATRIRTQSF